MLNNKTILITGGTGSFGNTVVNELLTHNTAAAHAGCCTTVRIRIH